MVMNQKPTRTLIREKQFCLQGGEPKSTDSGQRIQHRTTEHGGESKKNMTVD